MSAPILVVSETGRRSQEILDFISGSFGTRYITLAEKVVDFPECFSFIEDPEGALETLGDLLISCQHRQGKVVTLNQEPCILVDYGALAVAGAIARAARSGLNVHFRGVYPADSEQAVITAAVGLPRMLDLPFPDLSAFKTFPLYLGRHRRAQAHKSAERDRVADNFARYIDDCLARYGLRLSGSGVGLLCGLLGEVIGNAEDHCGRDDWWIGGYLRQTRRDFGDCHVAIFNFGETIYQTMQHLPSDARLRRDIEALVAQHTKRRLFRPNYGMEELWTLYALQGGASRFQESSTELDTDRGQGLAEMITFFQELGETAEDGVEPKMCILSGRTFIRFDRRYMMREQETDSGDVRRIIAFNQDNDLEQAPDERNVRRLSSFFPGTVISLRFFLDGNHLNSLRAREAPHG